MQADLTESVQSSIRPGEMKDTYYAGETNLAKQAYPCVVNTRFVQQFTNLGAGSSQFVLSPYQGMSDIIVELTMPPVYTSTGLELPSGWGYGLINRLSVRYGSSAQYFFSGQQMYLQNLIDAENAPKVDALTQLGGNAVVDTATKGAKAYLYLKLPHNSCRADGKPLPFASDNLVQPIVITIELYSAATVFIQSSTGAIGNAPQSLGSAQLQLKQEMLTDTSDLLARRVDMNTHAYTFPLPYFAQQETQVRCAGGNTQSINLTGFRAGEVKDIVLWLTKDTEQVQGAGGYQPLKWYPIQSVTLTYNGEVFSRFDDNSNQLWNLISDQKANVANQVLFAPGGTAGTTTPWVSYWTSCPFAQVNLPVDKEMLLVHGKPILNAVVNLQLTCPTGEDYTLHAMYLYNASLLCSRGSAEYIF